MSWKDPRMMSKNRVVSVPAPIGGLNVRDSLVAMAETDAVVLQNWWPQPYGCTVRKGYREWTTGLPSKVGTLATWSETDGTQKLFAWSAQGMYDVTAEGFAGIPIVTGLNYDVWSTTNLVNAAGGHLICVNGVDDGIHYSSAGADSIVAGDGIALNTWSGLDPQKCVMVTVHQNRLWGIEKDTANGWFLPPDAVQGVFQKFDFGPLFSRGGFLQVLTTWTIDDGNGAEDHLVAMSSRGEVAIYGGGNVESDTDWTLVGIYYIGSPIQGNRGWCKAGGDVLILTQQGVVSMGSQLISTKVNQAEDPLTTKKVQFLISDLTTSFGSLEGWELQYFPKINMVTINVPTTASTGSIQLAANQIINAWTQFRGMNAFCWSTLDSQPMFGDYSGRVLLAWTGQLDNVKLDDSGGVAVTALAQQAYGYLQAPAVQKQVGMYRPTFVADCPISFNSQILYDFKQTTLGPPGGGGKACGSLWNEDEWDYGIWGGGGGVQKGWVQAQGMGVASSLAIATQTQIEVLWVATDYSYQVGAGVL